MSEKKFSPEDVLKILRACNSHGMTAQERCAACPASGGGCTDFGNEEIAADAIEELLTEVKELRERLRWRSVEEELPELIPCNAGDGHGYSEAVQICTNGKKVLTAVYSHEGWIFARGFWEAWDEEITHWRPVVGNLPWAKEGV